MSSQKNEKVSHPAHYNSHPSGIEAIVLCRHLGFSTGNALKYLFRCGLKAGEAADVDLRKARFYLAYATTLHGSIIIAETAEDLATLENVAVQVHNADPESVLGRVLFAWIEAPAERFIDTEHSMARQRCIARTMLAAFDVATDNRFAAPDGGTRSPVMLDPAPGDMCNGTRTTIGGRSCVGCRACC